MPCNWKEKILAVGNWRWWKVVWEVVCPLAFSEYAAAAEGCEADCAWACLNGCVVRIQAVGVLSALCIDVYNLCS